MQSTWQDSLDPQLTQRLLKPWESPGVIPDTLARRIFERSRQFKQRLSLLHQFQQRWSGQGHLQVPDLPIVYAQPLASTGAVPAVGALDLPPDTRLSTNREESAGTDIAVNSVLDGSASFSVNPSLSFIETTTIEATTPDPPFPFPFISSPIFPSSSVEGIPLQWIETRMTEAQGSQSMPAVLPWVQPNSPPFEPVSSPGAVVQTNVIPLTDPANLAGQEAALLPNAATAIAPTAISPTVVTQAQFVDAALPVDLPLRQPNTADKGTKSTTVSPNQRLPLPQAAASTADGTQVVRPNIPAVNFGSPGIVLMPGGANAGEVHSQTARSSPRFSGDTANSLSPSTQADGFGMRTVHPDHQQPSMSGVSPIAPAETRGRHASSIDRVRPALPSVMARNPGQNQPAKPLPAPSSTGESATNFSARQALKHPSQTGFADRSSPPAPPSDSLPSPGIGAQPLVWARPVPAPSPDIAPSPTASGATHQSAGIPAAPAIAPQPVVPPTPPSPLQPAPVDVNRLTRQVERQLTRRLTVERERRGQRPW